MAQRVQEFDLWQPSYGGASVEIYNANTGTLASVYTNEALTVVAPNPQTLLDLVVGDIAYGKWAVPLYVGVPYYLVINGNATGIVRAPLTDLVGANASQAVVTPTGYTASIAINDLFAFNVIAEFYGVFGGSASANDAILDAAIGQAAALGVDVLLPANKTIPTNPISLPANVRLRGRGRDSTIIQINQASSNAVNFTGDRAGLVDLTLDGVGKQSLSVGLRASNKHYVSLENVLIKRFDTGILTDGITYHAYKEATVEDCNTGVKSYAGAELSGSNLDSFHNSWIGGRVWACSTGMLLQSVEKSVKHFSFAGISFVSNSVVALKLDGAKFLGFDDCTWLTNAINVQIKDNDTPNKNTSGTILFDGGRMNTGQFTLAGECADIVLRRMNLEGVGFSLGVLKNNILLEDCIENAAVTVLGTGALALLRSRTVVADSPSSLVVTTGAVATKAWGIRLDPGNRVNIVARIVVNARNTIDYAMYNIARSAHRPGSTLAYLNQTANFTVGDIITGGTSGMQARITADADAGVAGTLTLRDITGEFVSGEIIVGAASGSAEVNGVLAHQNCVLLGATTPIQNPVENDAAFACDFNVQADEVVIEATGVASKSLEWNVSASTVFG